MTPPDLPPRSVPRAPLTDVVPKRTLVIIAVVVALAVLGTVLALTLGGGDDTAGGAKSGASGAVAGGSASASADTKEDEDSGTRTDGATSSQSAAASGSASGDTSAAGGAGAGVTASGGSQATTPYNGGQGYTIGLPAGWKYRSSDAAGDRFTGPNGQKLLVAWTTTPKGDPVADWKNQERGMARSQYKKVRIEKVVYRGWNTADWEFTYSDDGTAYRTIDRGFVVNGSLGYALMYTAKSAAWDTDLRQATWTTLTESFTPKK